MRKLAGINEIKVNQPVGKMKAEWSQDLYDFFRNDQDIFKGSGIDRVIASNQDEILDNIWEDYSETSQEWDKELFEDGRIDDYPKTKEDLTDPNKQTGSTQDVAYQQTGMFLIPYIAKHLKKKGWKHVEDMVFSKNDDEGIDIFDYIELSSYDTDPREGLWMSMIEWLDDNWNNL
jgi:hypothetical protein